MLLNDTFKFGKFKNQTLEQVLSHEQGRDWLWWYVEQADNPDNKWYKSNVANKKSIRRKLEQQEAIRSQVKWCFT